MADEFKFDDAQVNYVSYMLQGYMVIENIDEMTADQCADLLHESKMLTSAGPQPGFRFREMLRQGRDGLIPLVTGASQQRPNTEWLIRRIPGVAGSASNAPG